MEVLSLVAYFFSFLCITLVAGFLAVVGYGIHVHNKYAHIPGPKRTSFFFGNIAEIKKIKDDESFISELLLQWVKKYGHVIVFFAMLKPLVVTVDEEAVKKLLITEPHRKSKYMYAQTTEIFGTRFLGKGLVNLINHEVWNERRSKMNPAFHRGVLKSLITEFNETADELCGRLVNFADGKTQIQLLGFLHRVTLDVIGKVAFGMDIDSINDDNSPFPKAVFKVFEGFSAKINEPFLDINIFKKRQFKQDVRDALNLLRETGKRRMIERKALMDKGEDVPDDVLSYIIKTREELGVELDNSLDDFVTMFVAGQETTANMLGFTFLELGRHPEMLSKARKEVEEIVGQKSFISYEDCGKMEYLGKVIKETLRLYPPAPNTFRDTSTDFDIKGIVIPKGTSMWISTYVSSRLPEFNPKPDEFMPDRFDEDSEIRPSLYTFFPFTLGPRSCIGQTFAQIEAKMILAKFIQRFNIDLDMTQSFEIQETTTLRPKDGTRCCLSHRDT